MQAIQTKDPILVTSGEHKGTVGYIHTPPDDAGFIKVLLFAYDGTHRYVDKMSVEYVTVIVARPTTSNPS